MNKSRIALEKDYVILLCPEDNNYEMIRIEKTSFYSSLMEQYPIYQSDTTVEEIIISIKPQEWNAQMDQNGQVENYLWIQSMQKKRNRHCENCI